VDVGRRASAVIVRMAKNKPRTFCPVRMLRLNARTKIIDLIN
jgi:hypothetical protein